MPITTDIEFHQPTGLYKWRLQGDVDGKPVSAEGEAQTHFEALRNALAIAAPDLPAETPTHTATGRTIYPAPQDNPACICPTPLAAHFCSTGHMLECHYPMTCRDANCSHMDRYQEQT